MTVSLRALGQALRRTPVQPVSVAALLERHEAYLAFRRIVEEVFPDAAAEILAVQETGAGREIARVMAFLERVERDYFPCCQLEDYDAVVSYGIPFARDGWSYDRFHDTSLRPGELLLLALCEQPFAGGDTRIPILDACEAHVPRSLLLEIPDGGLAPAELHQRLDATPFAPAAAFADWLWGDTNSVFLDLDDEMEVVDAEWTLANLHELAEQWQRAKGILDRIAELAAWLEEDLPGRFRALLDAALGRDAHLTYERTRRLYACEITEDGVVPIAHDESGPVALPVGPAR
ncbi:MAG: hypothetical protein HY689_01820 [Chloroflexi bacterium]|nr:hypothetical protein [Chloroflexota bacterium]